MARASLWAFSWCAGLPRVVVTDCLPACPFCWRSSVFSSVLESAARFVLSATRALPFPLPRRHSCRHPIIFLCHTKCLFFCFEKTASHIRKGERHLLPIRTSVGYTCTCPELLNNVQSGTQFVRPEDVCFDVHVFFFFLSRICAPPISYRVFSMFIVGPRNNRRRTTSV